MPPRREKARKIYALLVEAERTHEVLTDQKIAASMGWSVNTVSAYRGKRWHSFLKMVQGGYICLGISSISEDAFCRLQSQKASLEQDMLRPRFNPTIDSLIDKSRESSLLAVQIYNNPLIMFRTPGYIVQMIIAYTALFHAIFERDAIEYWYKLADGSPEIIDEDKKAWDISKCIQVYFKDATLPQLENLKFFIAIRNKIEHRFVPSLDLMFAGKCQALLMNYEELIVKEFGRYFALSANLALALQFSRYSTEQQSILRKVQTAEYDAIKKYSDAYDAILPLDIQQSLNYSFRAFLIPNIGNHSTSSDIAIRFVHFDPNNPEEMAQYQQSIALIRDRTKEVPVANKNNLKPTAVVERVCKETKLDFKMSHHINAWKLYKVRPSAKTKDGCNTQYYIFDAAFKDFVYTEQWVGLLCSKIQDPIEFEKIKKFR